LSGITIRDGTVSGTYTFGAMTITNVADVHLSRLAIPDAVISGGRTERLRIDDCDVMGIGLLDHSNDARVRGTRVGAGGISFGVSDRVSITGNVVLGGGIDLVRVFEGAVTDNTVAGAARFGLGMSEALDFTIARNRFLGNATGLVFGDFVAADVIDNVIQGNHGDGLRGTGAVSLRVLDNRVLRNGANGIVAKGLIARNIVSRNALDGIAVPDRAESADISSELDGNRVDHNGDDGIDVDAANVSVTGNHLWWNGDLGLDAPLGTLGGANWAKHNGNPAQCVPGSLCSTKETPKR
jgi:hypothetical protein